MKAGSLWAWREAAGPGEQDDDTSEPRRRCHCGAFLPKVPNASRQVLGDILTWGETEPDADGTTWPYPQDCTWHEEPLWHCKRCGYYFDADEMYE